MTIIRRTMSFILILVGGAVFSQAPEFTQQYRQRLGGALDELQAIVSAFEAQAAQFGLDRQAALKTYAASQSPFLVGQGETMRSTLSRYDTLLLQQAELAREPVVTRPICVMSTCRLLGTHGGTSSRPCRSTSPDWYGASRDAFPVGRCRPVYTCSASVQ